MQRRCAIVSKEVWLNLDNLTSDYKSNLMDDLFEHEFSKMLKKQGETKNMQRIEHITKRALKIKKIKEEVLEEGNRVVQPTTVVPSSIPWKTAECLGFATSLLKTIKKEKDPIPEHNLENTLISESRLKTKNVPTMEADSQSQDDVVFVQRINRVSSPIEIENDIIPEEHDYRCDTIIQTPVLRAVVRPENIERLSLAEKELVGRNQSVEVKEKEVCEPRNRDQEIQIPEKEQETESIQGGDHGPDSAEETIGAEAAIVSSCDVDHGLNSAEEIIGAEASIVSSFDVDHGPNSTEEIIGAEASIVPSYGVDHGPNSAGETVDSGAAIVSSAGVQSLPSEQSKTSHDNLLEEFYWDEVEGQNVSQPLGFLEAIPQCYPGKLTDSDSFLISDLFHEPSSEEFDGIGSTANPILYPNFSHNNAWLFGEDMVSPPLIDDELEPEEYTLKTTHWGDVSMMVSETSTNVLSKSPSSLEMDTTPPVLEQDTPSRVVKGRRKAKSKKQSKPVKVKDPSPLRTELVQITEKVTKVISKKGMFSILFSIQKKLCQRKFSKHLICWMKFK